MSNRSFLTALSHSKLVAPDVLANVGDEDPAVLAESLIERDLLTRWQAQQLLAGRFTFFLGKYKLLIKLGEGGGAEG